MILNQKHAQKTKTKTKSALLGIDFWLKKKELLFLIVIFSSRGPEYSSLTTQHPLVPKDIRFPAHALSSRS